MALNIFPIFYEFVNLFRNNRQENIILRQPKSLVLPLYAYVRLRTDGFYARDYSCVGRRRNSAASNLEGAKAHRKEDGMEKEQEIGGKAYKKAGRDSGSYATPVRRNLTLPRHSSHWAMSP